jgi:hypothetical protein
MPASSVVRPTSDARTPRVRSAVTNGSRLHVVPPGDGKWARRFADVLAEIISDLSGPDGLSEAQRQLARRAATIAIACERLEGEAAAGNEIDLELFGALTDRLGRCLQRLSPSLERHTRDITPPSVQEYLAHKAKQLNTEAAS